MESICLIAKIFIIHTIIGPSITDIFSSGLLSTKLTRIISYHNDMLGC